MTPGKSRRSRRTSKENEPRCVGMSLSQVQLPAPATTWSSLLPRPAPASETRRYATLLGTGNRAPAAYVPRSCLLLTNIRSATVVLMRCTRTKLPVSHGLLKPPSSCPPRRSPEIAAWCGGDTSTGSFVSKRGTSLADLHARLQMKSIATAAQSEAGTGLHAGLPGPVMHRPLQCTPRIMQPTPTQPSSTSFLLSPAY